MIAHAVDLAGLREGALLDAWEAGQHATPSARAQLMLSLGGPGPFGGITVGQRNERLLQLRAGLLGDRLDCLVDCPSCGDVLELALSIAELLAHAPAAASAALQERDEGGGRVRFRVPTLADVDAVLHAGAAAPAALLERCVEDVAVLDSEMADRISERMASADPLADIELAMHCPGCQHAWNASLDPAAFVWAEVGSIAVRTLQQVHALAVAYGWSEADILALGSERRQRYIDFVEGGFS